MEDDGECPGSSRAVTIAAARRPLTTVVRFTGYEQPCRCKHLPGRHRGPFAKRGSAAHMSAFPGV